MTHSEPEVKDMVCGMMVSGHQNAIEYQGMHFAFCSVQCKERFLSAPHLYIGAQGEKSPKQQGKRVIKRRRFQLVEPLPAELALQVTEQVLAMMGIENIVIEGASIEISYDLLQATAEQIETQLETVGAALGHEWGQRLRRAFVHYLEETEISSLEVSPSPHSHHH